MSQPAWSTADIPDQSGRVVIITGASSGIGLETAKAFAEKNAELMLAVRDADKGERAVRTILKQYPKAKVSVQLLDLAELKSVTDFAADFLANHDRLDLLINNAGIMMCPFAKTADGFEIQFGTNHLGHFALTGLLLPLLQQTNNSRVVNVSSLAHRGGKPDFSDLNWSQREYNTSQAYCDSKLANMVFTFTLVEKLSGLGNNPLVTAAHPGWTKTDLQRHALKYRLMGLLMAQNTAAGALPTLRAAVDPQAAPGDFFGPGGKQEMKGPPVKVEASEPCRDHKAAADLWELSEQMTGISY